MQKLIKKKEKKKKEKKEASYRALLPLIFQPSSWFWVIHKFSDHLLIVYI